MNTSPLSPPPSDPPFRVTDLKQWDYCPRILYYHHCLPDVRPVTYTMEAGAKAGKQEEAREVRRSLRKYGLDTGERAFNIAVSSPRLGLRGAVDLVVWPADSNETVPVDYKLSRKAASHFRLQVAAYGLMLEETYHIPVHRGFLYLIPLRKSQTVRIDKRLRARLQRTLDGMHATLVSERMPAATPQRRKCVACEFRRFCNDVL